MAFSRPHRPPGMDQSDQIGVLRFDLNPMPIQVSGRPSLSLVAWSPEPFFRDEVFRLHNPAKLALDSLL